MNADEHPPRLKRPDRLFVSHPLYFVTACTENRKPILANAKVHHDFQELCHAGLERGVFVGKYVLMPDHLHLFVAFNDAFESALAAHRHTQTRPETPEACTENRATVAAVYDRRSPPVAAVYDRRGAMLSNWMKSLKNSLSKTFRSMSIPAPHWQKGFFDHVMRSSESYSEKWAYVAENPVRKRLVVRSQDWPYQGEISPLQASGHTLPHL